MTLNLCRFHHCCCCCHCSFHCYCCSRCCSCFGCFVIIPLVNCKFCRVSLEQLQSNEARCLSRSSSLHRHSNCLYVSWTGFAYSQQSLPSCPLKWHVLNLATIIKKDREREREKTAVGFIWNDISIATAIFSHCHQTRAQTFYLLLLFFNHYLHIEKRIIVCVCVSRLCFWNREKKLKIYVTRAGISINMLGICDKVNRLKTQTIIV